MTFVDFCAGIGGGRLGLTLNGFECLGFSEIDKEAIKTYKIFFDTSKECEFGDLTTINPQNLPVFDLIISGFPCQTFSIVGKRAGLDDANKGQIIFHLAQILKVKQPQFFIFENVKGLINHDKGRTFKIINELLQDCGYDVQSKLLNTENFALPQLRERIYFVGFRKDLKIKADFFNGFVADYSYCGGGGGKLSNLKNFLTPNNKKQIRQNKPNFHQIS